MVSWGILTSNQPFYAGKVTDFEEKLWFVMESGEIPQDDQ